jgi:hypothetical protein
MKTRGTGEAPNDVADKAYTSKSTIPRLGRFRMVLDPHISF